MKSTELHINREDLPVRAWLYSPDTPTRALRPAVILCHGIPGSRPRTDDRGYLDLIEKITARGFACLAFNFRGCGLSGGNIDMQGWYQDLRAVYLRLFNTPGIDPSSIQAIGFSAGGAIAARLAALEENLRSLLLLATPADFTTIIPPDPELLREHFRELGVIRAPDFPADLERWHRDFCDLRPGQYLPFIAPRPVGIVHGEDDELVPPAQARELMAAAFEPKRLTLLPGAPHQLRRDPRTAALVCDWLEEMQ